MNLRIALARAVCLVVLAASCGSCADRGKTAAEAPDAGRPEVEDFRGGMAGNILPLPIYMVGEPDNVNFYDSTVRIRAVTVPDGPQYRDCSGVMVASNLALTAAHCLCEPIRAQTTRFDGSNCAAKVEVRTHTHMPPSYGNGSWMELDHTGNVLIHPQFEIVLDTKGAVVTSRADLALVRLEEPIPPDILEPARLAAEDVSTGELVMVVGFGVHDDPHLDSLKRMYGYIVDDNPDSGIRASSGKRFYVGLNSWYRESSQEVVRGSAGDDRYFFGLKKDDASFKGDTGGPCLRQMKCGQELVGISQRGLGQESTLTRIAPHRRWLEEQIRLASEKH